MKDEIADKKANVVLQEDAALWCYNGDKEGIIVKSHLAVLICEIRPRYIIGVKGFGSLMLFLSMFCWIKLEEKKKLKMQDKT